MGNSNSRNGGSAAASTSAAASAAAAGSSPPAPASPTGAPASLRKIELPLDMQPSAAVIGAGIAGVHVAKELATIGFKVTVLEQDDRPATGVSAADVGLVVPSTFVASPWKIRFFSDFLLGSLPLSARPLLAPETPVSIVTSVAFYRWAMSRVYQRRTSTASLQSAGESLAISSVDAMQECLSQDGRLRSAVIAEMQSGDASATNDASAAAVASADSLSALKRFTQPSSGNIDDGALIIDTQAWTRTLADVCQDRLDVRFLFNHKALRIKTKMTNGVEWAPYVVVRDLKKPPAEAPDAMGFDLVVVCAGGASRDLTWLTDPVPIHAFGGYSVDLPMNHGVVASLRAKLGDSKLFGNMSPDGWVKASPAIRVKPTLSSKTDETGSNIAALTSEPVLRVSGLASLDDSTNPSLRPEIAMSLLSRRLRLHQGVDASLDVEGVTARRYSRGFTPDGLPVVSRLGGVKNVFVCSGFGDNGALLAPGGARLLANIVVARSMEEELTPFSLGRFKSFRFMDPMRHLQGRGVTGSMISAEQALCRLGDVINSLWQEHVMSTPMVHNWVVQSDQRK